MEYTKKQKNKPSTIYISSGAVYGNQTKFEGFDEEFNDPDFSNFSEQKKNMLQAKLNLKKHTKIFLKIITRL